MGWTSGGVVARDFVNGRGPLARRDNGRDSAAGAYRTEVHPITTIIHYISEKIMRLQIAITAICSLKICQIALNESVKDRKVGIIFKPANFFRKIFTVSR